jgi:hypothetical protein
MSQSKRSNVFTHTTGIVAREGLHQATVISTEHVGKTPTKYGTKDFQMFHLRVTRYNDAGDKEIAEIHQQYHRSFNPRASMTVFLLGFGFKVQPGMTFDFDDLVGQKVNILVMHEEDSNGIVHANVKAMLLRTGGVR